MADRMKHCVSCLIYFTSTLLPCFDVLFKKRSGVYYQLSCINIFRFGLKNLKPLLAAESRSVQLLGKLELSEMLFLLLLLFALWYFFPNISNDSYEKMKGYLN